MPPACDCPVCCEPYTTQQRKKVECGHCGNECCSACLQQYLLTLPSDAQCMGCKRAIDGEFLSMHLPKTWLLTKYKAHREKVLLDREMALLPGSQDLLQNYRDSQRLQTQVADWEAEKRQLQRRMFDVTVEITRGRNALVAAQRTNYTQRPAAAAAAPAAERRQFIRACPVETCRGFLSSAWRCGTCETWVCKDCGEPKLEGQRDAEHVCNPDVAASHALLQRDSRPCPQCAAMIFKIEGCFGKDVPVLLWDGGLKMSQDVRAGDLLVGDDGTPRAVLHSFDGQARMYRVDQTRGMSYEVSDKHILLFKYSGEGVAAHGDLWKVRWFERETAAFRSKVFEERDLADEFFDLLDLDPVIEMTVEDYANLPESYKKSLMAFKCGEVHWESRPVPMDAYLLGAAQPNKDELVTGFTVTELGTGNYYGWIVDGNSRFLLQDFTVVHNCDQMWCTQCNVPFSWRTGLVVTNGIIHNPHYYEWLRRTRGQVPRNMGDVPCGGLPGAYEFDAAMRRVISTAQSGSAVEDVRKLRELHRVLRHVQLVDMPRMRREADGGGEFQRNADLRLKYLLNQVDEEEWRKKLQQREKKRERAFSVLQVYDMFVGASTDTFRALVAAERSAATSVNELRQLQVFANESLDGISKRFNMAVKRLRA